MWMLDNTTPYAAERNWTRDKHGAHHWIVAVKATFAIGVHGKLELADKQEPPALAPEHHGKPGESSLKYDSDLLAIKPGTDVIANASAHAPHGKPAPTVPVSLRVGPVHKSLLVHGVRVYYRGAALGMTTTEPRPFATRPILYEDAFGGTDLSDPDPRRHRSDLRNPIGQGFVVDRSKLDYKPAHTIEYPRGDFTKVGPAGFGAIDSSWSPRLECAGTYDAAWEKSKKPLLPDDFDERFGLCAPLDQRPPQHHLFGGEVVELVNLTPDGRLIFELPKIYLTFTTFFGRRRQEHRSRMSAVILEPDEARVMLVWQTTLRVGPRDIDYLDRTRIAEKPYVT